MGFLQYSRSNTENRSVSLWFPSLLITLTSTTPQESTTAPKSTSGSFHGLGLLRGR
ncbi:unnamed protein product, partial [Ectocarpus fasciculatus]